MSEVEECGDINIKCSSCNKHIGVVVVTRPSKKITNEVIFKCPFCGDQSFKKEIIGNIFVSGTDKVDIMDMNSDTNTYPDGSITQKIIIITSKKKGY